MVATLGRADVSESRTPAGSYHLKERLQIVQSDDPTKWGGTILLCLLS